MSTPTTISIDGTDYVRKDSVNQIAETLDGLPYVIVRSRSASPFAGYLKERDGTEATLINARRLWQWHGAATLSQLATTGTSKPQNCKFPCEVVSIDITQVDEVITCTEQARQSIAEVPVWES